MTSLEEHGHVREGGRPFRKSRSLAYLAIRRFSDDIQAGSFLEMDTRARRSARVRYGGAIASVRLWAVGGRPPGTSQPI